MKSSLPSCWKNRASVELDKDELNRLYQELSQAHSLAYITDNAGEIVLDKVFIKVLKQLYTHLKITVVVRGFPTLNDATYEDAESVGLTENCSCDAKWNRCAGNTTG